MRRFNFWIEEEMLKRLKKLAPEYGQRTIASVIRLILIKHLDEKK